MMAYKTYITIEDPNHVVLSNLPFQPGQRVEVVVLAEDSEKATPGEKLRGLFRETQAIPGVAEISEEEIAAEIEAYRREQ